MKLLTAIVTFALSATCPFALAYGIAPALPQSNGRTCVVKAIGKRHDDVPNILKAFNDCNNGGRVVFPETEDYWIGQKLNPILSHVTIEWRGKWTLSDNLTYWRVADHTYPVKFQNHRAGVLLSGDHIHLNGYGTGEMFGNGNAWYDDEKAVTQPGRPMPFVWWNASEISVEHFSVRDSPLWAINLMNVTNSRWDDLYVNSTAVNAPYGSNWVQNTDGFDTMDVTNCKLTNFVYQGGDDGIAIKPRSYNIFMQNITIHGGNGVAIGSLGQYPEDSSVVNVHIKDVKVLTNNKDMHNSAYIKTWIGASIPQSGYESAGLPNGGGWGVVQNLRFENFHVEGAAHGPAITQDTGNNGSYSGTSKMEVSNVAFVNWTGYLALSNNNSASVSCSAAHSCFNIAFQNVTLAPTMNATQVPAQGSCKFNAKNGVTGLSGSGCS